MFGDEANLTHFVFYHVPGYIATDSQKHILACTIVIYGVWKLIKHNLDVVFFSLYDPTENNHQNIMSRFE